MRIAPHGLLVTLLLLAGCIGDAPADNAATLDASAAASAADAEFVPDTILEAPLALGPAAGETAATYEIVLPEGPTRLELTLRADDVKSVGLSWTGFGGDCDRDGSTAGTGGLVPSVSYAAGGAEMQVVCDAPPAGAYTFTVSHLAGVAVGTVLVKVL